MLLLVYARGSTVGFCLEHASPSSFLAGSLELLSPYPTLGKTGASGWEHNFFGLPSGLRYSSWVLMVEAQNPSISRRVRNSIVRVGDERSGS